MKSKTFIGIAISTLVACLGIGIMAAVTPVAEINYQTLRAIGETSTCIGSIRLGDLDYVASSHYNNSALSSGTKITAAEVHKFFNPTITASGNKCFGPATGEENYGIKLGSGTSNIGSMILNFTADINVQTIVIYTNKQCTLGSTKFNINEKDYTCTAENYNFSDVDLNNKKNARGLCTYTFDKVLTTDTITIFGHKLCIGYISIY